jgi:uncharacterized protein (DUF1778 family)
MPTINTDRIDFRITPNVKDLIERAASLQGMTTSEFIKSVVVPASQQVVQQHETRVLSDRDRDLFLLLLDNPPTPNEALKAAARRLKNQVRSGDVRP